MKQRMLKAAFAALICLFMLLSMSLAVSAADNSENSLTLHYKYDNNAISGVDVSVYYVASPYEDGTFTLSGDFSKYPVTINKIRTVEEWDALAETLRSYAAFDGLEPIAVQKTTEDGIAAFTNLEEGIYLVVTSQSVLGDKILKFSPALLSVPALDEEGNLVYQVNAYPKHSEHTITPEKLTLRVQKLWDKDANLMVRPESVDVTILCDGVPQYSVTLSEANNWSYSWQVDDDEKVWSVIEELVPDNYTAVVEDKGNTFVITNTYEESDGDDSSSSTDMGDTTNIVPTILVMTVSGLVLILIGMAGRRSKNA